MEASPHTFEAEPSAWVLRAISTAAKMWCGAVAFFFAAFVFAYFYLRSLDLNSSWKIGKHVSPSGGIGVAILAAYLLSGLLLALAARRQADEFSMGIAATVLALVGVGLQFFEYSVLGFGPVSGAYASVFFGWTATYALGGLCGVYWMETQMATLWRGRRNGFVGFNQEVLSAGLNACAVCWTFFVAIGVLMFIVLYLV